METRLNNGSLRGESAFDAASKVESEAYLVLLPYFKRLPDNAEIVPTSGSLAIQKLLGDFVLKRKGRAKFIEVKAEMKWTGNLFIEEWSNRSRFTHGWLHTCSADVLAYYFVEERKLCMCPMAALKSWAFHGDNGGLLHTHPAKQQAKYDQMNDTWGRIVPVAALRRGVVNFVGPFDPTEPSGEDNQSARQLFVPGF